MSEHLTVEGMGSTRDLALGHADKQAEQYFDCKAEELVREIGRADARSQNFTGSVGLWCIRVEYRPKGSLVQVVEAD